MYFVGAAAPERLPVNSLRRDKDVQMLPAAAASIAPHVVMETDRGYIFGWMLNVPGRC